MFSERVMDHVLNPRNSGPMEDATHIGLAGLQGDGPYIYIYLKIMDGKIEKASYESNGCPAAISCASIVCQIVCGKLLKIVERIDPKDVLTLLGGLPEGKEQMAERAMQALNGAIESKVKTVG